MNKLTALIACAVLFLGVSAFAAVPDLMIDGMLVDNDIYRLAGEQEDLIFNFETNKQIWHMITERTDNANLNSFGTYSDLAVNGGNGENTTTIYEDFNSSGDWKHTNYGAGTDVGFWLLNDLNDDGTYNGNDSYLFSERSLTRGSLYDADQWFMVYDTRSFGEVEYRYSGVAFNGDYDYVIFIDDNHTGPNHDHNDMIIGLKTVPEPGTLLLLGSGLIGTGLAIRRRRNS